MSEFNEGDLIEAVDDVATETVIRGRLTSVFGVLGIHSAGWPLDKLEKAFTVTLIERPLPTAHGYYRSRFGDVYELNSAGWSCGGDDRTESVMSAHGPLTKLEPVAETARRVFEAIEREYGENYYHNSRPGWNRVAREFGVANVE